MRNESGASADAVSGRDYYGTLCWTKSPSHQLARITGNYGRVKLHSIAPADCITVSPSSLQGLILQLSRHVRDSGHIQSATVKPASNYALLFEKEMLHATGGFRRPT